MFFARINPAAVAFGVMFVAQAAILAWYAIRASELELSHSAPTRVWGWLLVAYSTAIYPLIGMWSGHIYPSMPMFGVTPCPLVIFTLGVLLFSRERAPWALFVAPALWSVIGGSAAFLLGVYQDWALPLGALLAILLNARKARAPGADPEPA